MGFGMTTVRNMRTEGTIGFFDSGLGGLSVWREVAERLPMERTVYLADNAHCPYGPKPPDRIIAYSRTNTERLLGEGCKLIVVACNTATAAAIDTLRAAYPIPFIGMEPAVKPAALASKCHTIGVLATPGTVQGRLYRETSSRFAGNTRILVRRVEGWVEAVERGETAVTDATVALVRREIAPLLEAGVDGLVLGCTHFPFLREVIRAVAGPDVTLYDPAEAIARRVEAVLSEKGLASQSAPVGIARHRFLSTAAYPPGHPLLAAFANG